MNDKDIQRVMDELEIRNLIARLAQLADNDGDDLREYLSHITEDGVWESNTTGGPTSNMVTTGHAAILAGAIQRRRDGVQGPHTATLHTVSTTTVKVDGDQALAKSYFTYLRDTSSGAKVGHAGSYNDEFRRTPQGWKLARRVLTQR